VFAVTGAVGEEDDPRVRGCFVACGEISRVLNTRAVCANGGHMRDYLPAIALLVVSAAAISGVYALGFAVAVARHPLMAPPYMSGNAPVEHAFSRFHVRWYAVTLVFLTFDMEMVFMYPWAVVLTTVKLKALLEMYFILSLLMLGVVYAWREGALRWA